MTGGAVAATAAPEQPERDCPRCPRLVAYRRENRARFDAWHNAPVASFGPVDARLLIVGLAPGLRGANRTGRPFTGDFAGELLYRSLIDAGFARGRFAGERNDDAWPGDTLELIDCRVTNAVRCVPPENKPLPNEIANCLPFLAAELAAMPQLRAVLALGRVAHDAVLTALALKRNAFPFVHGRVHDLPAGIALTDSYHCSRYNTQTGRLTTAMFAAVIDNLRRRLPRCDGARQGAGSRSRAAGIQGRKA